MLKSNGNVLFLILIAVVLFAALSFAISSTTRTSGSNVTTDLDKLNAGQISQACGQLRNAAMRFMMTGVTDTELLVNDGVSTSTPCRTGNKCLFSASGGEAIIPLPPQVKGSTNGKFAVPPTPTQYAYYNVANGAYLTGYDSNRPLVIFEAYPLEKSLCEQLNVAAGLNPTPEFFSSSNATYRDACYDNGSTSYLYRCPLTH